MIRRLLVVLIAWQAQLAQSTATAMLSDTECRAHGFDPWQLACSTCDLLRSYIIESEVDTVDTICRKCCQAYKDTVRIEKPYEAAVLLYSKSMASMAAGGVDDELAQFLKQDWDELAATKNKASSNRLLKQQREQPKPDADSFDIMRMMMLMRPQAQLYLFKDPLPTKPSALKALLDNVETLEQVATEVIQLDNSWKRDDLKDMLTTLLP